MASIQRGVSSRSDGVDGMMDDRKRKRLISNRESARRSRMRKLKQLEDFRDEVNKLQSENQQLLEDIEAKEQANIANEAANGILKAQTKELTDQLRFLNSIIEEAARKKSGSSAKDPKIPDPQLKLWQIPYPNQVIMTSSDWFLH